MVATRAPRAILLTIVAFVLAIAGLGLTGGGIWLIGLGGSWYYGLVGVAFLATAVLLFMRRPSALWLYAAIVAGSVVWALTESGFDWWPLAARGDVIVIVGAILLLPWITRALGRREADTATGERTKAVRGGSIALAATLVAAVAVGVVSWFSEPHRVEGQLAAAPNEAAARDEAAMPPGEWHAYGRTDYGQRYAPLDQITPENVDQLQVAWTYHTGDMRGQQGDPAETTFEVTPLKIDERLFLCTPHQKVIALDATTGEEAWRYDTQILDDLALQHLTCRGLAYYPGPTEQQQAPAPGRETAADDQTAEQPVAANADPAVQDLPVAAARADRVVDCTAMLFMPTADGRVIALDPDSGGVCGNFGDGQGQISLWPDMPNIRPGAYYSTSPVQVVGDRMIVGGTVLDNVSVSEQSGVIRAYAIPSGELLWAWDPGDPDQSAPLPEGETYTANSPNSWSIMSADADLGLVYVPMGNQPPDQWGGNRSDAVERYSSAVVALDVETGAVRWVYQTVHHDLWDYDVPSQPSLVDLTIDGEAVPALVQPTKQGDLYVLDRRTGEPIVPVREVAVPQGAAEGDYTAPTQPVSGLSFAPPALDGASMWGATMFDQLACRIRFHQLRYEGRYTPPSREGSLVYPGNFGVFNWGSIAVDPRSGGAFVTPTYIAFVSRLIPRENDSSLYVGTPPEGALPALNENFGAPFAVELKPFTSFLGLPCQQPPWGYVAGADLATGEVAWMHRNGTVEDLAPVPLPLRMGVPNQGGPILTAGGLAFLSGTLDYYVRAYDAATGEQLWKSRLPAGGQATPMSYAGRDGRQYLLVVAGGHGSIGTAPGDSVIAYALPQG